MQLPFLSLTVILATTSVFIQVDAAATSFSTFKKETVDTGSLALDTLETASYLLCAVKCHNKDTECTGFIFEETTQECTPFKDVASPSLTGEMVDVLKKVST